MNYKYLMDSNVLATSSVMSLIDTDFFGSNCIVIKEVAYELASTSIGEKLEKMSVAPSLESLARLRSLVDPLVTLGILKADHGNGEAMLLAEALCLLNPDESQTALSFLRTVPVVVTNETAVDVYAKSIGISAISGSDFVSLVKAAEKAHGNKI